MRNAPRNRSRGKPKFGRVWPRLVLAFACLGALGVMPLTAGADSEASSVLSPGLLAAARAQPNSEFDVIVQGEIDSGVERRFDTVPAAAATLTGSEIVSLAEGDDPHVITRDSAVVVVGDSTEAPASQPAAGGEPAVFGNPEPGAALTATPAGAGSYRWQRCGEGLREEAMLADAPLGRWAFGERAGDIDVEEPAPDSASAGFSVEGWVELDSPASDLPLIARWSLRDESRWFGSRAVTVGATTLYLDEGGHYGLAGTVRTSVAPQTGEREHLAVTWDGTLLRLYRNGVQIGAEPLEGQPGSDFHLRIAGSVDDVAVYDRALSSSEVRGHHAGCTDIAGAGEATYQPTATDLGLRLRVVVNGDASALTDPVTAKPPTMTSPPSILGTTEEGQTLQAANGSWEGTLPLEFQYQWRRCHGESCVDIGGAGASSYTPTRADVGATIRLELTVRGLGGEASAHTEAASVVTAIPERLPKFKQHWPYVAGVPAQLASLEGHELEPATIAIVDSGIDVQRPDFGSRVIERVTLSTRSGNQSGDGNGHGTAVASVAAGEAGGYTGAAPGARLVDVDVLDDDGAANVSDVIAAADWIYNNRERLNIRVANFSLHGTTLASLVSDPLDKAVERLWLSGIVVVAAAGNYAVDGQESAVAFAPANDPFILTVGATDTRGSYARRDDIVAPWSAWGYTRDGFSKPELGAPGRYIAAAVSPKGKLARDKPERIVEPGYMQLSGTSLAAPVVSGIAANLLAAHPEWTPDQVKGALMLTAKPLEKAPPRALGVGAVDAGDAAAVSDPPNPNAALDGFLVSDPEGARVFDADRWTTAVQADPAWASVAWGSVAWGSAAWSSVAWGSVAWGSVAWGSVAWGSVAWGSVAWGSVAWRSDARDDVRQGGGYWTRRD